MLKHLLHRVVAHPYVYDRIQTIAGVDQLYQRIGAHIGSLGPNAIVIDIGGGTGLSKTLLDLPENYFCLDMDIEKLVGFVSKHNSHKAVLADGAWLPIASGTVDLALCVNVAHHLTDDILTSLVRESLRVIKDTGHFVFVDPVWDPSRRIGKLIWRYDRGSNPRTSETLNTFLAREAPPQAWETFTIHHRYVIGVLTKQNVNGTT